MTAHYAKQIAEVHFVDGSKRPAILSSLAHFLDEAGAYNAALALYQQALDAARSYATGEELAVYLHRASLHSPPFFV